MWLKEKKKSVYYYSLSRNNVPINNFISIKFTQTAKKRPVQTWSYSKQFSEQMRYFIYIFSVFNSLYVLYIFNSHLCTDIVSNSKFVNSNQLLLREKKRLIS